MPADLSVPPPDSASFGAACAGVARQHPFKVMAIVGGAFFLAGLGVSLSLGALSKSEAPAQTVAAAPAMAEPVPAATSTQGTASATDGSGTNCDKQTWPYMDRACLDALAAKSKAKPSVRVVSTDREAPPALEAGPPALPVQRAPDPQPSSEDALTPITPVAPKIAASASPVVSAAEAQVVPEPPSKAAVIVSDPAPKEEPRAATPIPEKKSEPRIKSAAIPVIAETDGKAVEPGQQTIQVPKAVTKKERKRRAKREKRREPREDDTMLVRDTVTYPDGRRTSVIHRVKRDDRYEARRGYDEDDYIPRPGYAAAREPP